jgi:hypothetical protein
MTRYIVTWIESAQEELAQIWIDAPDRQAVTAATHAIDKELVEDAATKGSELREGLRELTVPPLRVLFLVREEDRLVEVSKVRYLPSPPLPTRGDGFVPPTE